MTAQNDERRSDTRTPVSVRALVRFASSDHWVCTIRDFCAGGMLVKGDSRKLLEAYDGDDEGPSRGTPVEVHFAVKSPEGKKCAFHHRGIIARTVDGGLGLQFEEPLSRPALQGLARHASPKLEAVKPSVGSSEKPERPKIQGEVAKSVLKTSARFTQRHLLAIGRRFVLEFRDELISCHSRASTDGEREDFAMASAALQANERDFVKQFVGWVVEHLVKRKAAPFKSEEKGPDLPDGPTVDSESKGTRTKLLTNSSLSLVAKDDFEQWLVVADMVSSIEGDIGEEIFVLQNWLGLIAESWQRKETNPLFPATIIRALERALDGLGLQDEPARLAFEVFNRACRQPVVDYYERLVALLAEMDVFPSIDEIIADKIKNAAPSPERPKSSTSPETDRAATPAAASTLLNVANSLRGGGGGGGGGGDGTGAGGPGGGTGGVGANELELNEVLQALSRLPKTIERQNGEGIRAAFMSQISEQGQEEEQVPQRVLNALDMVDYMVASVDEDEALTKDLRSWIKKLEVTLGKEAARNDAFLASDQEEPHAAFQMLNQLEGVDADTIDMERGKRASQRVDAVLQRLVDDWEGNTDAFVHAVEELEPLVDQQKKLYARNVERVVNGCEGKARLRRAKQIVLKCLSATFEGKPVPDIVLEVINPAWRNLLVNTALREGTRAVVWKQQLKVIRRLAEFLCSADAEGAAAPSVRVLTRCVQEGFESIGHRPRGPLLDELAAMLSSPEARNLENVEILPVGGMAPLLGWESLIDAEPMPPTDDEASRDHYLEMLRRARVLRTGSRVKFEEPNGESKSATLAWAAPSGDQFVFVNRRGLWDRELTLAGFTEQLASGEATVLDGYDVPLVERVSERMLSRIHGKITDDAQKDELTELSNRRSYERTLTKLVALARHTESAHCLLQIDLDQFKIVNSTCGYDGGDALLKQIADALKSELSLHEAMVARIGADEFAAVLRNKTVDEGQEIADRLVRRFRHMQFEWGNSSHSLSTTIAVLGVDQTSDEAPTLMQNLASACRAGKDQGGDCVYVFVDDDEAMLEQRSIMQLASQVEQFLEADRLRVNCQQIAAIGNDDPLEGHYEVLISVVDDGGEARSPVGFIEAAERYGKMPLVDRFVVSSVLGWMAKNRDVVDQFGGFSINLSGQSIKQDDFLDFVLEQFETTGAPAEKVCFEVTETAAMGNLSRAAEFIQKIRVLGCSFSLDDFGTGMSSYAYLRELPVDYLKIDGTFVKNMATDLSDQAVVRSINEVGHFMGKRTVAEFVHDQATLDTCAEIGVDFVQGWHIEKPRPIDTLLEEFGAAEDAKSA